MLQCPLQQTFLNSMPRLEQAGGDLCVTGHFIIMYLPTGAPGKGLTHSSFTSIFNIFLIIDCWITLFHSIFLMIVAKNDKCRNVKVAGVKWNEDFVSACD